MAEVATKTRRTSIRSLRGF